jgi:hypothetical protein
VVLGTKTNIHKICTKRWNLANKFLHLLMLLLSFLLLFHLPQLPWLTSSSSARLLLNKTYSFNLLTVAL